MAGLAVRPDGLYVDCTFGRGGHSSAILARLGNAGRLLAVDRDTDAIASENARTLGQDARVNIEHGRFGELAMHVARTGWRGKVSGILIDLGVSSPQLEDGARGFSFMRDGPLDMRMDQTRGITAAEWLAVVSESELCRVLKEYGEERYARKIAHSIVDRRRREPLVSTAQLAALIAAAIPRWEKGQHPATRSFQAIRIRLNDELAEIESVLAQAVDVLAPAGRLVVVAFHSLEDRLVKRFIRHESRGEDGVVAGWPGAAVRMPRLRRLGRAIRPTDAEVRANPRARSAILRIAERLPA